MKKSNYQRYFIISLLIVMMISLGFIMGYKYSDYKMVLLRDKVKNTTVSGNYVSQSEKELKEKILTNGDARAYDLLHIKFLDKFYVGDLLLYDLIMANKYSNPNACFYVYSALTSIYDRSLKYGKVDDISLKLALQYLFKGDSLKDANCAIELYSLYKDGKYLKKDSMKSNYYDKEANRRIRGR